jgi:hypothetical protein
MAESANLVSEMDSAVQTPTITIALFVIATYNYYSRGMGRIQPTEHIASIKTNEVHVSFCHSNQRASYPPNKVKFQGSKATLTRPPPSAPFSALLCASYFRVLCVYAPLRDFSFLRLLAISRLIFFASVREPPPHIPFVHFAFSWFPTGAVRKSNDPGRCAKRAGHRTSTVE